MIGNFVWGRGKQPKRWVTLDPCCRDGGMPRLIDEETWENPMRSSGPLGRVCEERWAGFVRTEEEARPAGVAASEGGREFAPALKRTLVEHGYAVA